MMFAEPNTRPSHITNKRGMLATSWGVVFQDG